MKINMDNSKGGKMVEIIARYLVGNTSNEENEKLKEWIESSDDSRKYFHQLRNIWEVSDKQIDPMSINAEKALDSVIKKTSLAENPKHKIWFYWQKIASVLFIPLIVGNIILGFHFVSKGTISAEPVYNEIYANFGTRSSMKLSDGSLVWLNSGSSLKYPVKFTDKERTVYLDGEAYFEVQSNPSRPFIVQAPDIKVKATGTKFNILGHKSHNISEITLVSGKVEVIFNKNLNQKNSVSLNANQHLVFNKNSKATSLVEDDTYKYIAWKDGKLVFRNQTFSEVLNKLSQVFNVDFEIRGDEILNYRYRATFEDESLSEILKLLKLTAPIDYQEVIRKSLPDGSFPKKKVIIYSTLKH
jgi:ferric-dicitrate binding protein FerR (iron transport regulator)